MLGLRIVGAVLIFGVQDGMPTMADRLPIAAERMAQAVDDMCGHMGDASDRMRDVTAVPEHTTEGV